MTDDEFVRLWQTRMAAAGHDIGPVDGIVGKRAMAALDVVLPPMVLISPAPSPTAPASPLHVGKDNIPDSGDAKLKGVHAKLVEVVCEASLRSPSPFTVIEGLRTKERQAQLVKAGASKTQNSRHLTGHAVDLWPLDPATMKPLPSDAAFKAGSAEARHASAMLWARLRELSVVMFAVAKEKGVMIEWGGNWQWDAPHFQLNRKAYPA